MSKKIEIASIASIPVKKIPLSKLEFDLDNARFLPDDEITSEKAYETLCKIGNIVDLAKEIVGMNGIIDPLLIIKKKSKYIVKEGNRRLAACTYILNNETKSEFADFSISKIKTIPCKIVPNTYKEVDIRILLLSIHIRVKYDWRLFNRAHYIIELRDKFGKTNEEIANYGVMSKSTVLKTTIAYNMTLKYKKRYKDDETWSTKYSYFYQLYTSKKLEEFRHSKSNLSNFLDWVHDKKFKDYQDVRDFHKIINNNAAYSVFKNTVKSLDDYTRGTSFKEALKIVEGQDPGLVDKNFKIFKKSIDVINQLTRKDIINIRKDENKIKYVKTLHDNIRSLYDEIKFV